MKTGLLKNFKTVYCESPCEIRQCALNKGVMTCGDCADIGTCQALSDNYLEYSRCSEKSERINLHSPTASCLPGSRVD